MVAKAKAKPANERVKNPPKLLELKDIAEEFDVTFKNFNFTAIVNREEVLWQANHLIEEEGMDPKNKDFWPNVFWELFQETECDEADVGSMTLRFFPGDVASAGPI